MIYLHSLIFLKILLSIISLNYLKRVYISPFCLLHVLYQFLFISLFIFIRFSS